MFPIISMISKIPQRQLRDFLHSVFVRLQRQPAPHQFFDDQSTAAAGRHAVDGFNEFVRQVERGTWASTLESFLDFR